jgi:NADH-quinone oxidoreductase subunit A
MFAHSHIMFSAYRVLVLTFLIGLLLVIILVLLALIFSTTLKISDKLMSYECGFQLFQTPRFPIDIHFYLIGIFFLIFDMEVIFIYPWFGVSYLVGWGGLGGQLCFLLILIFGFIYEYNKEVLIWNK